MPGVDKQSPEFFKALDSIRAHSSIYQGIERVRSRYAGTWKGEGKAVQRQRYQRVAKKQHTGLLFSVMLSASALIGCLLAY